MSPIAGAFAGLISYGVEKNLEGAHGYRAWQWLFIIEGSLTIAFSLLIIALLPGLPDIVVKSGHFMFHNETERSIISKRMREGKSCLSISEGFANTNTKISQAKCQRIPKSATIKSGSRSRTPSSISVP